MNYKKQKTEHTVIPFTKPAPVAAKKGTSDDAEKKIEDSDDGPLLGLVDY